MIARSAWYVTRAGRTGRSSSHQLSDFCCNRRYEFRAQHGYRLTGGKPSANRTAKTLACPRRSASARFRARSVEFPVMLCSLSIPSPADTCRRQIQQPRGRCRETWTAWAVGAATPSGIYRDGSCGVERSLNPPGVASSSRLEKKSGSQRSG